jgi:pimeloyl-ACP methyl ester carboxylesterase
MKRFYQRKIINPMIVLSITVLFVLTACSSRNNHSDLQLTYIGEATDSMSNITYFLQGPEQGEVVVLLPGMGRGACEFRELASDLNQAGYRTVAIQPRGIGRSGPILTNPSYDRFAADIALVLEDIPGGITGGKAHVLGYEFGNRIARMFAVKYPDHVQSLILLACGGQQVSSDSSSGIESHAITSNTKPQKFVMKLQNHGVSSGKYPNIKTFIAHPSIFTDQIDVFFLGLVANTKTTDTTAIVLSGMTGAFAFWLTPSQREPFIKHAFFAPMSQVPYYWITGWYRDTGWMQEQMDVDHVSPTADWVGGGNAPMLVLQGQYDVAAPVSNGTYMKETYPDRVTMAVVPDAGHAMLAEQTEFIFDQMLKWFKLHPIAQ